MSLTIIHLRLEFKDNANMKMWAPFYLPQSQSVPYCRSFSFHKAVETSGNPTQPNWKIDKGQQPDGRSREDLIQAVPPNPAAPALSVKEMNWSVGAWRVLMVLSIHRRGLTTLSAHQLRRPI